MDTKDREFAAAETGDDGWLDGILGRHPPNVVRVPDEIRAPEEVAVHHAPDRPARQRRSQRDCGPIQEQACPGCGQSFTPTRRGVVYCPAGGCRRRAWRKRNPTLDEMVNLPENELSDALHTLHDRRLAFGRPDCDELDEVTTASHLVKMDEGVLRDLLRAVMVRRHPHRRGRFRVRFGQPGDAEIGRPA